MKGKKNGRAAQTIFMTLYTAVLLIVSVIICINTFDTQKTVAIDDRDMVLQRRSNTIAVAVEIKEARWGAVRLEDRELVFEIARLLDRLSLDRSEPATKTKKVYMEGQISYIDGSSKRFFLSDTFILDGRDYSGESTGYELNRLRGLLTDSTHTVKNLAGFFGTEHSITLAWEGGTKKLESEAIDLLHQGILASSILTDSAELRYSLLGRGVPSYSIIVKRFGNVNDLIRLAIYEDDYIEISDVTTGNGNAIYLSGELMTICNKLR